ncbi:molybdenum cofactor guanylyltransferase [Sphingobium sp. B12D2B]|uniref:molybdenum cofactor guanylyltransferase n=1 Tax=Sphingobium sp. B12D2B TaxID=2940577 RepID=UPI002224D605|nr:molybdenum cofactor guanylyltransferase [Sphingobium sp. B12D2B]MCW2350175.1 molybdopterin-guanine dinucleotide biosynthesis protein A [Sphingobium sp. B12D2B]
MSCCVGLLPIDRAAVLGAVIAGGKSTRFGSDKAVAPFHGRALIDHAIDAVAAHSAQTIMVGREHDGVASIADQPAPHMGPLAGLAAALLEAQARGLPAVLSVPCDAIDLPQDLLQRLSPYPAYVESLPVIGLWPASAAGDALDILKSEGVHSMKAFANRISARAVQLPREPVNINTAADLERVERHGL